MCPDNYLIKTRDLLNTQIKMKKKLLAVGVFLFGLSANAQLTYVGNTALVTVTPSTLFYNGGGMQVAGTGQFNNYGNVMIVGVPGTDKFQTVSGSPSFVLKLTTPASYATSSYGQLYISGLLQGDITGNVYKEYRDTKQGTYQQVGLPFYNKTLNTLSTELGKTFSNTRYSKNEVLKYDANYVVAMNTAISTATTNGTDYYMLGSRGLDTSLPPSATFPTGVYSLVGIPYSENITQTLSGAASNVPGGFGTGGYGRNIYNEYFNSYLQDNWDVATPWTGTFGKNIYQYSNPYFTNLDLSGIYLKTPNAAGSDVDGDGNDISNIKGIRINPGTVISDNSGTYSTTAQYVSFPTTGSIAVGDVDKLVIKPLQTFVIKLTDNTSATLKFANLRRFGSTARTVTSYSVTAAKNAGSANSMKQLGVIALNAAGEEMGRTYFVVYDNGVSGHTENANTQVQNNSDNVIGTYEENAVEGGVDNAYSSLYWLYINEVNEKDFKGKAVPLNLYNSGIKSLKFEMRENEALLDNGVQNLSTGIGFYYKANNGSVAEISQGMSIPVSSDQYSLFYGEPSSTLGTDNAANKPSRTQIVYNPSIDNYIVRFDSGWKKADIQVYDMSGKLVLAKKSVSTNEDFVLQLPKGNTAYVVTVISEKGVKATAKIIR